MIQIGFRNLLARLHPIAIDVIAEADRQRFGAIDRRSRREMQRLALASLLSDMLNRVPGMAPSRWHLHRDAGGAPRLVVSDPIISVSFSHSGPLAMVALTDLGEIGVDAEHQRPRPISELAAYAFGRCEQRAVEVGGRAAFYRIWTLREALSKARGVGFPMLTDGRDYFSDAPTGGCWQTRIDQQRWLFWTGKVESDYALSIALAPRSNVRMEQLAELIPRTFSEGQR
jgi:phosphopantetheinyl transferase